MNKLSARGVLVGTGAASLMLLASDALAHGTHLQNHHAAFCVTSGTGDSITRNTSRITNNTSGTLTVLCPVDHANQVVSEVIVLVRDNDSNADISCTLRASTQDGAMMYYSTAKTLGRPNTLTSLRLPADTIYSWQAGYTYLLSCQLPPNVSDNWSRLHSYLAYFGEDAFVSPIPGIDAGWLNF